MLPTTNRSDIPKRRLGLLWGLLAIWIILLAGLALHRQALIDWFRLRTYQPSSEVAQIASQDTMTDEARRIFYVNTPAIQDKNEFGKACAAAGAGHEQTIVLGCYHSNQAGIFVLKVTDPRLSGVEQVTAAHEMLHAAYDRLKPDDKKRLDAMLEDYYRTGLHDQRVLSTIDAYKKSEPNDLVNEMHSIFATEVATLPSGLEQYYKRYFNDRAKVTSFAAQYQSVFTSRQAVLSQQESRLDSFKTQIDSSEADLKAKQNAISDRQAALEAARDRGDITTYNAGVGPYNALVDAYNAQLANVKSLIDQFNQLVAQHNALVLEQSQLRNELDVKAAPIKQ